MQLNQESVAIYRKEEKWLREKQKQLLLAKQKLHRKKEKPQCVKQRQKRKKPQCVKQQQKKEKQLLLAKQKRQEKKHASLAAA